jgi:hypothetical protein
LRASWGLAEKFALSSCQLQNKGNHAYQKFAGESAVIVVHVTNSGNETDLLPGDVIDGGSPHDSAEGPFGGNGISNNSRIEYTRRSAGFSFCLISRQHFRTGWMLISRITTRAAYLGAAKVAAAQSLKVR